MKDKVAAVAGATAGWGGAFVLIFTGDTRQSVLAQAFLIGVGLAGSSWLMQACRNRPMSASFEVGYEMGRRDAIREGSGAKVIQLRPDHLEERHRMTV